MLDRLAHELGPGAPVMVVDPSAPRRRRLLDRLARTGLRPLEARAPLEAVHALAQSTSPVRALVVAPTLTQTGPPELARFVAESFPSVRVVQL